MTIQTNWANANAKRMSTQRKNDEKKKEIKKLEHFVDGSILRYSFSITNCVQLNNWTIDVMKGSPREVSFRVSFLLETELVKGVTQSNDWNYFLKSILNVFSATVPNEWNTLKLHLCKLAIFVWKHQMELGPLNAVLFFFFFL